MRREAECHRRVNDDLKINPANSAIGFRLSVISVTQQDEVFVFREEYFVVLSFLKLPEGS